MKKVLFGLLILSCSFVSVSFADFQSELNECKSYFGINACKEKVYKKYMISKKSACAKKDGFYNNQPIQANRSKKKIFTSQFYKYQGIVYYPIDVYPIKDADFYNSEHYLYSYNCKTKKVLDMNINTTKDKTSIISIELGHKEHIVVRFSADEGWRSLFVLDTKKLLLENFSDFSSMKNYDKFEEKAKSETKKIFNTTTSKEIGIGMGTYPTKIAGGNFDDFWKNIDKRRGFQIESNSIGIEEGRLVGRISVSIGLIDPEKDTGFTIAKIDFLTKTITVE